MCNISTNLILRFSIYSMSDLIFSYILGNKRKVLLTNFIDINLKFYLISGSIWLLKWFFYFIIFGGSSDYDSIASTKNSFLY